MAKTKNSTKEALDVRKIQDLQDMRPFRPFVIELVSGREMPVPRPEDLHIEPDRHRITVFSDRSVLVFGTEAVASIAVVQP
jgi:hypothetical protein